MPTSDVSRLAGERALELRAVVGLAPSRSRLHVIPRGYVTPLCDAFSVRGFDEPHSPGPMSGGVCRRCSDKLRAAGYGISWAGVIVKEEREQ